LTALRGSKTPRFKPKLERGVEDKTSKRASGKEGLDLRGSHLRWAAARQGNQLLIFHFG